VESFASRAGTLGIQLETRAQPTNAHVDPVRMRQAIGNLVDNALRHATSRVTVSVEPHNGGLTIVGDDGPGFPEEFLDRAGQGFSRPDLARPRGTGGTGLGLAIVRAIAEAHGATLAVENDPSGGARVTLTVPA
jgi:signal transduction histidine kinase